MRILDRTASFQQYASGVLVLARNSGPERGGSVCVLSTAYLDVCVELLSQDAQHIDMAKTRSEV